VRAPRSRTATIAIQLALPLVFGMPLAVWLALELGANRPTMDPTLLLVVWFLATTGWLVARAARVRRGVQQLLECQALITAGSFEAGGELCERILAGYRGVGEIEAPALCNLSVALYHRGEAAQALALLDAVERAGWCFPRSRLRTIVLQNRATYLAVLGRTDEAERLARELRTRLTSARAESGLLLFDAILSARTGRMADVVARTGTVAATRQLQAKLLRILRAWALDATAPEASRDEVRLLIEGARPIAPGELGYIALHWPELKAFLVAHGLGEAT
jgi:hypothetical protein